MTAAKRKALQRQRDEFSAHAGALGFDLKGPSARRWGPVIALLLALLAVGAIALWLLLGGADRILGKTQEAVNRSTTIERKLDSFKDEVGRHQRRTDRSLSDLSSSVKGIQALLAQQAVLHGTDLTAEAH